MDTVAFVIDGIKYIATYKDNNLKILKLENNALQELTTSENEKITKLLNRKTGYKSNSELLTRLLTENNNIESKEDYGIVLNWIEKIIPEEHRQNLYTNIKTLVIKSNVKRNDEPTTEGYPELKDDIITGAYDYTNNTITISEEFILSLRQRALKQDDPSSYFAKYFSKTMLHESLHMASSKYDKSTGILLNGFETYPYKENKDRNKGLTEGYTEFIAMCGVPGTTELASGYFIETRIIAQLTQIIGTNTLSDAYFGNKGTTPLEEKLCKLINDKDKAAWIFRKIEMNFQLKDNCEEQYILSSIQYNLLEYLEKKLEMLSSVGAYDEIDRILPYYESMLITPETLKIISENKNIYKGTDKNTIKFQEIKSKYSKKNNETTYKHI